MYQIFEGAYSGSQDQLCALRPSKNHYPCLGYSLRGDWYAEDEEDSSGEDEDAKDADRGSEEEEETGDDDDGCDPSSVPALFWPNLTKNATSRFTRWYCLSREQVEEVQ
ncbi:hypothetical protein BJ165DRAFT_1405614 [Panaeolus papilionaceus]|nr:hypothetical protein BJ165DRAFT_1405614 [Panaeolus papilionaceus]